MSLSLDVRRKTMMKVKKLIVEKKQGVLPGTICFETNYVETKSIENYPHRVMELKARRKVKLDNMVGRNQRANGEVMAMVMAVVMTRVHEVVIKHQHRQELKDHWQRLHHQKVLRRQHVTNGQIKNQR